MHIKQIIIQDFRSFHKQYEINGDFSPGTNTVVGRNGSGKSNLFDAVQFVLLAPKFWTLRAEDRQALLHQGSGSTAVSASVEIIFDNHDNRFSLNGPCDEVVLRRTVGHKKDEFYLQRKRTQKQEVMSLLEGAGFSKSNPYYVVQQGKVNALCTMRDTQRLDLLKEVAGTTVYDEKKKQSMTKMKENQETISKIQVTLGTMEDTLNQLKEDTEELTHYQKLDRVRRAMAYTLYDKELKKARETLDTIEHQREEEKHKKARLYEQMRDTNNEITAVEDILKKESKALKRNREHTLSFEEGKTEAMTKRMQMEFQTKELEENVQQGEKSLIENKKEIEILTKKIAKAQTELDDEIEPKFQEAKDAVSRITTEREETQNKIDGLYEKQGRGQQYTSKEDRDQDLRSQIKELEHVKMEKEGFLNEQQDTLANLRRSISTGTDDLNNKMNELNKKDKVLEKLNQDYQDKRKQRHDMAEERKVRWGLLSDLSTRVADARDSVNNADHAFRKTIPRNTAIGLKNLSRIVAEEKLVVGEQYFGPVMNNFELVDPKYQTAIEAGAQNQLFHVIVDTDATAARLIERLQRDNLGRVTFLPLNTLQFHNSRNPDTRDVRPLISCLKYNQRIHKAMHHVFGRKILAKDAEVAHTWATRLNMDAVTLDGDICERKGCMVGGYRDESKSRLKAYYSLNDAEDTFKSVREEERSVRERNSAGDQELSSVISEMQKIEAKKNDLEYKLKSMDNDISSRKKRFESIKRQSERIASENIPLLETNIKRLSSQIQLLEEEMGTDLRETLTANEKRILQEMKHLQSELKKEMDKETLILDEFSIKRQRLKSLLDDNLLKRKRELEEEGLESLNTRRWSNENRQSASSMVQNQRNEQLEVMRRELDEVTQNAQSIDEKLSQSKKKDEEIRVKIIDAQRTLEKLQTDDIEHKKAMEDTQKIEDKIMNKRSLCVTQREHHTRNIQELGSLPPISELSKHKSLSITALMKKLESINKDLKAYSHVNTKAFDQFVAFNEKRDILLNRKKEVDQGAEKVQELIDSLDRQKDEAINRTFRGVSKHFREVFKELVPNGAGELIMRTSLDEAESGDEEMYEGSSSTKEPPSISTYRGIGIKVRFTEIGENYLMEQLSGGQKSLVAMALIFAIQRCDPAPFYLFDELDQALDSNYRKAVAGLIQRQANSQENPTQFICSTFRPELVSIANRCYGVSHQSKASDIHYLSKNDALKFIASLMEEEEKVGEVTSLATSRLSASFKKRKVVTNNTRDENIEVDNIDGSQVG